LGAAVAGVKGRELDRNARSRIDALARGSFADGADGGAIILQIALGIPRGRGGLTQHVVGIAEAPSLQLATIAQRLGNGLARNELLAHQLHRQVYPGADHWLARARHEPRQRMAQPGFIDRRHQLSGDHQSPGGGIDEQRAAAAEMGLPVAGRDLVGDQRVARTVVGRAQQRFGQAHQRHSLLARQGVFLHQAFDAATPLLRPHRGDNSDGQRANRCGHIRGQSRSGNERRHAVGLGRAMGCVNGGAQRIY
jgi:hypothetical protein